MKDEELDALVRAIDYSTRDPETGDDLHPGVFVHLAIEDAVAASVAITALRAQLAEARARADRAEATLRALIDTPAAMSDTARRWAADPQPETGNIMAGDMRAAASDAQIAAAVQAGYELAAEEAKACGWHLRRFDLALRDAELAGKSPIRALGGEG